MRMFDSGGVKLALLKLLSEEPAHGYQLIKKMEQKLAGGYTPSAGAIYPTLTLLEEEGLIAASMQENKKIYSVTADGAQFLESNKTRVEALFAQLEEASRGFARGRSPELMRAFANLRSAVSARVSRGNATEEQIRKMAAAIDTAAKTIDEL
jgi:DNA-binding PadR family transcriptional regulator